MVFTLWKKYTMSKLTIEEIEDRISELQHQLNVYNPVKSFFSPFIIIGLTIGIIIWKTNEYVEWEIYKEFSDMLAWMAVLLPFIVSFLMVYLYISDLRSNIRNYKDELINELKDELSLQEKMLWNKMYAKKKTND